MPRFLLNSAGMRVSLKNGVPSSGTCLHYNHVGNFWRANLCVNVYQLGNP
jgi:hypothetical protein